MKLQEVVVFFLVLIIPFSQVKTLLTAGGATREFYVSDLVTHVIAGSTEFPEYSDAKEYGLTVVLVGLSIVWSDCCVGRFMLFGLTVVLVGSCCLV